MRKSFLLLCLCVAFPVQASLGPYYLGGSFGRTDVDTGVTAVTGTARLDEEDTGYKIFAGLELNKIFSIEAHYADLGEASLTGNNGDTFTSGGVVSTFTSTSTIMLDSSNFGVSALARLPIDGRIKPFAKFGVHIWEFDASVTTAAGNAQLSDDGTDIFYGVGVDVKVTDRVSARAEFERFDFDGDDIDFLSIGLIFRGK